MTPAVVSSGYWLAVFAAFVLNGVLLRRYAPTQKQKLRIWFYSFGVVFLVASLVPAMLASSYAAGWVFGLLAVINVKVDTLSALLIATPIGVFIAFLTMYIVVRTTGLLFRKIDLLPA